MAISDGNIAIASENKILLGTHLDVKVWNQDTKAIGKI